jgi:hypothetical protein
MVASRPTVPCAATFASSKGTSFVKDAYAKTDQNNHHSFENRGEKIRNRRSLASIRFVFSVFSILHSTIIPLVLET